MRWAVERTASRAGVHRAVVRLAGEITAVPTVATVVAMGAGMIVALWVDDDSKEEQITRGVALRSMMLVDEPDFRFIDARPTRREQAAEERRQRKAAAREEADLLAALAAATGEEETREETERVAAMRRAAACEAAAVLEEAAQRTQ